MINKYLFMMILSGIAASFAQVMLKTSAKKQYSHKIQIFLNPLVIAAYSVMVVTMFVNIAAYRGVAYKTGVIIGTLNYIYVILMSRLFFAEKINRMKVCGMVLILIGIYIFTLEI